MTHQATPMDWDTICSVRTGAIRRRSRNAMMSRWWYIKDNGKNARVPKRTARGRKRKSDVVGGRGTGGSPPTKRVRTHRVLPGVNEWNDEALKKLQTLKRTLKHSAWFWEPVQEVKHSAKHY